ncbi:hypothetical protein [Paraburkholderia phenoliruptrix]|uniref:Uncharacterized protein n=1 Tax=Paraburkholderia phenoliruptrix TaxID=252970 RepID=A0ABV3WJR7_9BURK
MVDAFTIETSLNFQYEILVRSETIHAWIFGGNLNRAALIARDAGGDF